MRSKIVIMENHDSGIEVKGVSSLLDVYDRTQAGDLVTVYPGTYDIGNNSIQLKDGVNWKFMPGVVITANVNDGIFKDNNVAVKLKFEGEPELQNSGNDTLQGTIRLQKASSKVSGFYYYFKIFGLSTADPLISFDTLATNLPSNILANSTINHVSTGIWELIFGSSANIGSIISSYNEKKNYYDSENGYIVSLHTQIHYNKLELHIINASTGAYTDNAFEFSVFAEAHFGRSWFIEQV